MLSSSMLQLPNRTVFRRLAVTRPRDPALSSIPGLYCRTTSHQPSFAAAPHLFVRTGGILNKRRRGVRLSGEACRYMAVKQCKCACPRRHVLDFIKLSDVYAVGGSRPLRFLASLCNVYVCTRLRGVRQSERLVSKAEPRCWQLLHRC